MFGNSRFERVNQLFADQFEADGTGFLYRKSMKGAPIRVTAAERDGFVEAFKRRQRYAVWLIVTATVLLIGLLAFLMPDVDSPSANVATYIGLAAILVPILFVFYWTWNAPARELERRPRTGEERTRAEVRRIMLAKMTYGQLSLAVIAALLLVWRASGENDILHGWGVVWLAVAVALIVGAAIQAIRKWMHERD